MYISSPNKGQGRRYKQKQANTQFMLNPVSGTTGTVTGDPIQYLQVTPSPVSEWLSAYSLNDYLLASVYLVAEDGRRALIGTQEIQVIGP
jgi:hypothetical protein